MPWTWEDAEKHKKGLTKEQAKKWAKIANSVRKQCIQDGGKASACDKKAIKVANSKVNDNNNKEEDNSVKHSMKVPSSAMCFSEEANINLSEPDDDGKQAFSMEAYSGKIIKGHSFWGDLAIDVSGIQFNQKRIPILEDHMWNWKLGVSNSKPSIENNRIAFDKVNLLSNEKAQEFKQNLDDGFPYQASISIRPTKVEELEEGASTEVNGYTMKGPGKVIRQSIFREASACVFGADHRTSVSSLSDTDEDVEVEKVSLKAPGESTTERKKIKKTDNGGIYMYDELLKKVQEENPDLYDTIKELADKGAKLADLEQQVKDLAQERDNLKKEKEDLSEVNKENQDRIAKLEKAETIRKEKDLKDQASAIVDQKLNDSELPARLHKRIKGYIDHNDFVDENDGFKEEDFSAHVDTEIESWKTDLKELESKDGVVLGLSGSETPAGKKSEEQNFDDVANTMLELAGVKVDKE